MDWQLIANIFAGGVPLVMLNSYVNKLVLENAINKTLLKITKEYVSKEDFEKHIRDCPVRYKG